MKLALYTAFIWNYESMDLLYRTIMVPFFCDIGIDIDWKNIDNHGLGFA